MNSRYTYKAKRKNNGEWVYGYYVKSKYDDNHYITEGTSEVGIKNFENGGHSYACMMYQIIPETLCQCTGLQDIEGNYIFENDIVYVEGGESYYGAYEVQGECEIKYLGNHFEIVRLKDSCGLGWGFADCLSKIQIIGNKFDKEGDK